MKDIHCHPTPLRQKFIEHLTLHHKAERTIHSYVSFIYDLARLHHQRPDTLTRDHLRAWLLHLIAERRLAPATVNLAFNSLKAFYGDFLRRDLPGLLHDLPRPTVKPRAPRPYGVSEIERLLTFGTADRPRDRAFLALVYGAGLRLSEATHTLVADLDTDRHQLRVSHPKGGRQRLSLLSEPLAQILRDYWITAQPRPWLFPGETPDAPITRGTGQNLFYRAVARAQLPDRGGIHSLRHSFASHLLESGVEITVVQRLLGHASLLTTARYLHVRPERLSQIQSPLGLFDLAHPLTARP
jgi:site-specific recombinase XerD